MLELNCKIMKLTFLPSVSLPCNPVVWKWFDYTPTVLSLLATCECSERKEPATDIDLSWAWRQYQHTHTHPPTIYQTQRPCGLTAGWEVMGH